MELDMSILDHPLRSLNIVNPLIPPKYRSTVDQPNGLFSEDEDDPLEVYEQYLSDPNEDILWKAKYYRALRFQQFHRDPPISGVEKMEALNLLAFYRVIWIKHIKQKLGKEQRTAPHQGV